MPQKIAAVAGRTMLSAELFRRHGLPLFSRLESMAEAFLPLTAAEFPDDLVERAGALHKALHNYRDAVLNGREVSATEFAVFAADFLTFADEIERRARSADRQP